MSDVSMPETAADRHPIWLVVYDDLGRNRLTVFFRLLLAIPHFVVVSLWGIVAVLAVIVAWFVGIFTGSVPEGLHDFIASFVRYSTRVAAYVYLLADPWPPFS